MSKNEVIDRVNVPLCICDSTLGSGEQAAGTVFSSIEKYRIAQILNDAGVPQIEAGNPSLGPDEKKSVRHIARMGLSSSIMSYNRAEESDIDASIDCGVDAVTIGFPASEILIKNELKNEASWVLDKVYDSAAHAVEHGLYTCVVAEDASRADLGFLIEFAKAAKDAGADRLGYCDSYSMDDPFTCNERIKMLRQISGMEIEILARNDFGLATANTFAAVKAGAKFARTTAMGLGPRAGCAALEDVVMNARHMLKIDTGIDTTKLATVADAVSAASGIPVSPIKPFIGRKCYELESGILSDPACMEAFDPKEMGMERKLVVGKNSVRNTILVALSKMNVNDVSAEEGDQLLAMVRKASVMMHRSLSEAEVLRLYEDMKVGNDPFDDGDDELPSLAE